MPNMKNINSKKYSDGMTLVEMVVTMAIFVAVMLAATTFASNIFSYRNSISSSYTTVLGAETMLKTMSKEIRMMSPGSDGSYSLQRAATNTLMFYADTSSSGVKTRIKYSFIGNQIYRTTLLPTGAPLAYTGAESTTTLVFDVRNTPTTPVFEYFDGSYDGNDAALAQPVDMSRVRLIKINITLDTDPNKSPAPRTYTAFVTLRNLKDNQ